MTIRQLYYTSCEQGKEGIRGFQVNAASVGLAERHEDLGLRLSAYRPSPSAPVLPTAEQVAHFPVAVGYRSFGDVAVLFHSRYLGTDFTGRQGNYFAHVLVLDAPDRDLDGMLPVEAWQSALWTWQPSHGTQLPLVEAIPPGPLADRERIRAHLLAGRLPEFGVLLSAVQEGLSGHARRVVVVAPDAVDVARAIAAVTRSLPRTLASRVSFTTFTSSPADADVLVAGTTPDVDVASSPYGDQLVVTLAGDGSGDGSGDGNTSRYASVLGDCWLRGIAAVGEVTALAARVTPALEGAELDQFADLVELAVPDSADSFDFDAAQATLPALEFALRRLPSVLTPALWQRIDDQVRRAGSFDGIERWSAVLAAAEHSGTAPGPELESAYLRAVLSKIADGALDPGGSWLPARASGRREKTAVEWAHGTLKASPQLTTAARVLGTLAQLGIRLPDTELRFVVDEVILPELLNPHLSDAPTQLRRLPQADRLLSLVCTHLEGRLATETLFDTVVEELPAAVADLLESAAPRGSRCALAASLARARTSRTDRVPALLRAVPAAADAAAVERVAALLWPDLPTAEEGVQLCCRIDAAVLGATSVPQRLLDRLIEDAGGAAGLSSEHKELADLLAAEPIVTSLGNARDTLDSIQWGAYFTSCPAPSPEATQAAVDAVRCAAGAATAVANEALEAVANWMLSLPDPAYHAPVLVRVVQETGSRDFLTVYGRRLAVVLASTRPTTIAVILPAIVFLADKGCAGRSLLDTTCRDALARRSKRELDAVGRSFDTRNRRLAPLLPITGKQAAKNWPSWWNDWRGHNLPQSALSRFFRRGTSGCDD